MSSRLRIASLVSVLALLACKVEQPDPRDKNRPDSFGDGCSGDAGVDVCVAPFSCLMNAHREGVLQCTLACDSDDDCPHWEATGHCAGPVQIPCEQNICQPRQCK